MLNSMTRIGQMLSFRTLRCPLDWSILTALILLTLATLWLVWVVTESQWAQWIVVTGSLLVWNLLVVRAGERQVDRSDARQASGRTAVVLFLSAVSLLALAAVVAAAFQNSALFPGRQAIDFIVISVPLMIWANVYLAGGVGGQAGGGVISKGGVTDHGSGV
jgi:hypothetical protein